MPLNLDRLPFDVLFFITGHLGLEDVVQLSLVCRTLYTILDESPVCRRAVETDAHFSHERALAESRHITYREALRRIIQRRLAHRSAAPSSAALIGYGSSSVHRNDALCYLAASQIHVLDLYNPRSGRHSFNIRSIIDDLKLGDQPTTQYSLTLLNYNARILVIHVEPDDEYIESWLVAVKVDADTFDHDRVVKYLPLVSTTRLFVRHDASFLYYGTHSRMAQHGHHEWEIQAVSLDEAQNPLDEVKPLQLADFAGSELGAAVAFEIHGGRFYAVTNQTTFDVEEVDWTSFYTCIRFPLAFPSRDAWEINRQIYRRQHAEGPINDSWTDISLQVDQHSGDLVIVEARREWLGSGSSQYRSFYFHEINDSDFSTPAGSPSSAFMASGADSSQPGSTTNYAGPLLPLNEPLTRTLTSRDNPRYAETQSRNPAEVHPEYGCQLSGSTRTFTFARTKFRGYNLEASCFIDLVEDDTCCHTSLAPCLRLRMGSRRPAPGLPIMTGVLDTTDQRNNFVRHPALPLPENQHCTCHYRSEPVKLWPRTTLDQGDSSDSLHDILNPPKNRPSDEVTVVSSSSSVLGSYMPRHRHITASMDAHSLIYHIRFAKDGVSAPEGNGAIVCVGFDSAISPLVEDNLPIWRRY